MGECYFWYRPTRVVPDQRPLNSCVCVCIGHHITYKLCLTTWKTLHTSQPLYLSELISHYLPSRSLRSSNTNLLTRPDGITSNFCSQAFSVSAPSTWNSLPAHTRSIDTLSTFKRHLKFHLFQSAFTVQSSCASASDSFSRFLVLYKSVCMYVCIDISTDRDQPTKSTT